MGEPGKQKRVHLVIWIFYASLNQWGWFKEGNYNEHGSPNKASLKSAYIGGGYLVQSVKGEVLIVKCRWDTI